MAYSNPNIPTIDIEEQDPTTGYILEGTCSGVPAATAGYFAVGCELEDRLGSGSYVNTGTVASPVWSNELAVTNSVMDIGLIKTVTLPLTAANLIAMYTTPIAVVPAITGKSIYVQSVVFDIIRTATAFTGGGVVNVQYDSTANGAGTTAHADIAAAVVTGAAGTTHTERIPKDLSDIADASIKGIGLYVSNKTGVFAAGTGTATLTVRYYAI